MNETMTHETNRAADDMLACPFCGSRCEERAEQGWHACSNNDCPAWHLQALAEDWNTRAAPAEDFRPPIIKCLQENGDLIALKATVAQQAELIRLLRAEDVRAMVDEPVAWAETSDLAGIEKGALWSGTLWGQANPSMLAERTPLYRSAQRKTVMPERMDRVNDSEILGAMGLYCHVSVFDAQTIWNACLDEFKRLNKTDG